jgi:hypothetical protein
MQSSQMTDSDSLATALSAGLACCAKKWKSKERNNIGKARVSEEKPIRRDVLMTSLFSCSSIFAP